METSLGALRRTVEIHFNLMWQPLRNVLPEIRDGEPDELQKICEDVQSRHDWRDLATLMRKKKDKIRDIGVVWGW